MVDKGGRVFLQPRRDEVDDFLEHSLFGLPVMRPKCGESGPPLVSRDKAEQVFEIAAVVEKRITLRVKKDVARIGLRQPGEALARSRWKQFALIFAGIAFGDFQRRLMLEAIDGAVWIPGTLDPAGSAASVRTVETPASPSRLI
jgi:hypothetical protein